MNRNINIFIVCCVLCLISLIMYNVELMDSPRSLYMNTEKTGIPRPLRKFVPTPIEVDISKLCEKICNRNLRNNKSQLRGFKGSIQGFKDLFAEMNTCFDPKLSVFVYDGTSPENMSFEQKFTKFMPKIDTEEAENKWKHNRSLCPVNELDESLHTMTKQETCAVIGNSGILLGSECGEEINSHDFVLRANLATLEGYTEDVGTKTNMMMINFSTLHRIYSVLNKKSKAKDDMLRYFRFLNGAILWYPKGTGGGRSNRLRKISSLLLEENIPAKFAFNFVTATGVTKGKWKTPKVASSGLIAFTVAQTFCKNVTLYGFYPYQHDEYGVPVLYHYYEPNLLDFHTSAHNFDREHRLLRSLHDKHSLKLVIGSCTNRNESAGLRPIPEQHIAQPKPARSKLCDQICDRDNQICFDPSLAIIVYDSLADARRMSFQQTFTNVKITNIENDTKINNIKADSNDANLCPITDVDPSFRTMTVRQSCAIVGNNGVLSNSKCGKEIDSHSFIFRANMAEVESSIEDTGNKTGMMMLNLQTVDFIYDTLFARRRTSQRKRNHAKLLETVQYLNDSIIWYPESTANGTAKKLQKIAGFFQSQKMNVRFGFSFTGASAQTQRRWKTKDNPSSRFILLTVAETFCKKITMYGFHSSGTNATNFENNVDSFYNERKIFESLQQKGVLSQVLNLCEKV